jgi:hypothetical protein
MSIKRSEIIYNRYENLAVFYANKIWSEHKLAYEKEDLYQDMKMKLFLTIKAYGKRWKEYKNSGNRKPIPIQYYIRTSMANRVKDFIAEINAAQETDNKMLDRGTSTSEIEWGRTDIKVGLDYLSNLANSKYEKKIIKLLVLKNFDKEETLKYCINKEKAKIIIEISLEKIREYLISNQTEHQEYIVMESFED